MTTIKELEKQLLENQKLIREMQKKLNQKPKNNNKQQEKTEKTMPKKTKTIISTEIPKIIEKMNKTEIKTLFGLDIGKNHDKPYHCLSKEFIKKYNIVSGNKYPVYLKYEHKHAIIKKLYGEKPKNMCIEYLKGKISTATNEHIEKALQNELNRWE